jgi:hypothetical protein
VSRDPYDHKKGFAGHKVTKQMFLLLGYQVAFDVHIFGVFEDLGLNEAAAAQLY